MASLADFVFVAVTLPERQVYYFAANEQTEDRAARGQWTHDITQAVHFNSNRSNIPGEYLKQLQHLTQCLAIESKFVRLERPDLY